MRVALYTRVSTTDKGQTVENQKLSLRQACDVRGWPIVLEREDQISGTKQRRPGLDSILEAANRQEFDTLMVWSLDRLTREGAFRALEIIQDLTKLDIGFYSLQEPYFDTIGPFKDAIIAIAACLARLEREKIVERVKAGLERTKASGTVLGPPRIIPHISQAVLKLHREGVSAVQISKLVAYKDRNPCAATVRKVIAEYSLP